jgi:hypothetical protein
MSKRPEIYKMEFGPGIGTCLASIRKRRENNDEPRKRKEGHNTNFRIHEFSPGKFDVPGNSEIGIVSPISLSIPTRCQAPSINNLE